jgi:ribosome-associated heat shock protein Hsp15
MRDRPRRKQRLRRRATQRRRSEAAHPIVTAAVAGLISDSTLGKETANPSATAADRNRSVSSAARSSQIRIRRLPNSLRSRPSLKPRPRSAAEVAAGVEHQRIDRWLWHARIVRTRDAAAGLADAGHIRVNGARIDAPSRAVRIGDVVTVALDRRVRVLKVCGFVARRGPASSTETLYEELS